MKETPQIILTSFHRARKMSGDKYSICRFQPSGSKLPELRFLAAEDASGCKLLIPSRLEADQFAAAYRQALLSRWELVRGWLDAINPQNGPILLLCWCPFSEATKAEMRAGETFLCHSGLIGKLINHYRPDVQVCLDEDREAWLDVRWRPMTYEVVNSLGIIDKQQNLFCL